MNSFINHINMALPRADEEDQDGAQSTAARDDSRDEAAMAAVDYSLYATLAESLARATEELSLRRERRQQPIELHTSAGQDHQASRPRWHDLITAFRERMREMRNTQMNHQYGRVSGGLAMAAADGSTSLPAPSLAVPTTTTMNHLFQLRRRPSVRRNVNRGVRIIERQIESSSNSDTQFWENVDRELSSRADNLLEGLGREQDATNDGRQHVNIVVDPSELESLLSSSRSPPRSKAPSVIVQDMLDANGCKIEGQDCENASYYYGYYGEDDDDDDDDDEHSDDSQRTLYHRQQLYNGSLLGNELHNTYPSVARHVRFIDEVMLSEYIGR